MSLFDTLDTYVTTPRDEIKKIALMLQTPIAYYGRTRFSSLFVELFPYSDFSSYETSFSDFLSHRIFIDFEPEDEIKTSLIQYRFYCEFLLNLLSINVLLDFKNHVSVLINQTKRIIEKGLNQCGYAVIQDVKNRYVTRKKNEVAESIASLYTSFKEPIFEFLLAKTIKDKEVALTSFSIKLEAYKGVDGFFKSNKEFVQLLRHKEEKIVDTKYSWFFKGKYEDNLDKLFKLFLSMIIHKDGNTISEEFKKNSGGNNK